MWQWTQETLAEFSGVSLSVVERVEGGVKVSDESCRRIAQALGWRAEAFLEPRERLSFQEALLATTRWFSKHYVVSVHPLKTQPQIAELVRTDGVIVDGSRIQDDTSRELVGAFEEWLDFASWVVATTEPDSIIDCGKDRDLPGRREVYRNILDAALEIGRRGYTVLAGTLKVLLTEDEYIVIGVVSFFPLVSDPAAAKRPFVLIPKGALRADTKAIVSATSRVS